jgi:Tol biopolymer transport system component
LGQTYYVEQGPLRVFNAKWSPDGKLLALQTAVGYREELMYSNKLVILNTLTGELYRPEIKGSHIWDVEWFPDSRYLVVMGYSDKLEHPYQNQQISIVDSLTQQSRLMLPDHVFGGGSQAGFQLALSPNGKSLTVSCPITSDEYPLGLKDQVCLISIN